MNDAPPQRDGDSFRAVSNIELHKMFRTCIFTVSSAIASSAAISLFRLPLATSCNTCISRSLIASSPM